MNQFVILSDPKFKKGGCPDSNKKGVDKCKIVIKDIRYLYCRTAVFVVPIGTSLVTTELNFFTSSLSVLDQTSGSRVACPDLWDGPAAPASSLYDTNTYLGHMV